MPRPIANPARRARAFAATWPVPGMRWLRRAGLLACWLMLACWGFSVQAWDPDRIVQAAARHGEQAVQGARALRQALAGAAGMDELGEVGTVNDFFNHRLMYRDDQDIWGQVDYWASPLEALQKGMADCEDYAIAKYFTLTALGVPHRKLRLVYVRVALGAASGGPGGAVQPHMVLAYYPSPDAEPYVLDNLVGELRRAGRRPDLSPVFSFNAEGLWEGVGPVAVGGAGPVERLSRWRDALAKARQDGFSQ